MSGIHSKRTSWISRGLLIGFICVCSFLSIYYAQLCAAENRSVTLAGQALSVRQVQEIVESERQREEGAAFTYWNETQEQSAAGGALARSQEVSLISAYGNPQMISPAFTGLDSEDTDGCLIDADTAYVLFGTTKAVGNRLTVNGQDYTVRHVLCDVTEHVAVIIKTGGSSFQNTNSDTGDAADVFTVISLSVPDGQDAQAYAQRFCARNGIDASITETSLLTAAAGLFSMLLPTLLPVGFAVSALREARRQRSYPVRCAVFSLLGVAFLTVLILCFKSRITVSPSVTPTKWSDFGFWSDLFANRKQAILELAQMKKTTTLIRGMRYALCAAVYGSLAAVGGVILFVTRRSL